MYLISSVVAFEDVNVVLIEAYRPFYFRVCLTEFSLLVILMVSSPDFPQNFHYYSPNMPIVVTLYYGYRHSIRQGISFSIKR